MSLNSSCAIPKTALLLLLLSCGGPLYANGWVERCWRWFSRALARVMELREQALEEMVQNLRAG